MNAIPEETLDLLAAHALGALEPAELERVSQLLREHPELERVLAELRAAADMLPYALEAEPAADLRQRSLDRAFGRSQAAPARSHNPIWQRLSYAFGTLAAVLALALGVIWNQLGATQTLLADSERTQRQILAVMAEPDALVRLAGDGQGQGAVIRRADGTLLMAVRLPQLQVGRVYQLWFIEGDQAPRPSQTFTVDPDGLALITLNAAEVTRASVFAITAEPAGGSQVPTMPLVVAGSVS
jgi:anti-sigma-K factor RskA